MSLPAIRHRVDNGYCTDDDDDDVLTQACVPKTSSRYAARGHKRQRGLVGMVAVTSRSGWAILKRRTGKRCKTSSTGLSTSDEP